MFNGTEVFFDDFCTSLSRPNLMVEIVEFTDRGAISNRHQAITKKQLSSLINDKKKSDLAILGSVTNRNFGTGRAGKKDIQSKNHLIFDLDLKDSIGKDALDQMNSQQKKDRIESILKDKVSEIEQCGLGKIWFALFSGNGMHLWFKCEGIIPTDDLKLYENFYLDCQRRLEKSLGMRLDDSFQSPAQLIRLPLSYNCKGAPIKTELLHHNAEADSSKELHGIFQEIKKTMEEKAQQSTQKPALRVVGSNNNDDHKEVLREHLTFERVLEHKGLSIHYSEGKAQGKEYVIKSPWNDEQKPSCYLNLEKKVFDDKSSKKKGDIFGFIAELHGLNPRTQFKNVLSIAEDITGIPSPITERTKQKEKGNTSEQKKSDISREDYYAIFNNHLPELSQELLTGQLLFRNRYGKWVSALNHLGKLKAEANEIGLKPRMVEDYLYTYGYDCLKPRLLVDLPEWDGVDRLQIIADCIHLKKEAGITKDVFLDYLKQFGAMIFEKLEDNSVQNSSVILILVGSQGIGKDKLIQAMFDGLGMYYMEGTLGRSDKDDYQRASQILVWNISEFDQTARIDVAYLKDFVTKREVCQRNPYLKAPQNLLLRHSLIASCNEADILRDTTGNRRYAIFEIESIDWNYPLDQSSQILAQFKSLKGHRVSQASKKAMNSYVVEKTPPTIDEQIIDVFDNYMRSKCYDNSSVLRHNEALFVISEVAKMIHVQNLKVTKVLTSNGRSRKGTGNRREIFLPENKPLK